MPPATSSTICIGSVYWRRKRRQRGLLGRLGKLVRAVLRAPGLDLRVGQASTLLDALLLQRVVGRERPPCSVRFQRRRLLRHDSPPSSIASTHSLDEDADRHDQHGQYGEDDQ